MNEDELGNGQEKKITMPIISKKKKKKGNLSKIKEMLFFIISSTQSVLVCFSRHKNQ